MGKYSQIILNLGNNMENIPTLFSMLGMLWENIPILFSMLGILWENVPMIFTMLGLGRKQRYFPKKLQLLHIGSLQLPKNIPNVEFRVPVFPKSLGIFPFISQLGILKSFLCERPPPPGETMKTCIGD